MGSLDEASQTFLITHAGNRTRHILETALSLAHGRLHVSYVPNMEQSARHGDYQSVSD